MDINQNQQVAVVNLHKGSLRGDPLGGQLCQFFQL